MTSMFGLFHAYNDCCFQWKLVSLNKMAKKWWETTPTKYSLQIQIAEYEQKHKWWQHEPAIDNSVAAFLIQEYQKNGHTNDECQQNHWVGQRIDDLCTRVHWQFMEWRINSVYDKTNNKELNGESNCVRLLCWCHLQIYVFCWIEIDGIDCRNDNQHTQRNGRKQFNDMLCSIFKAFFFFVGNIASRTATRSRCLISIAITWSSSANCHLGICVRCVRLSLIRTLLSAKNQ